MTRATLETRPANNFRGGCTFFALIGIFIGGSGAWGPGVGLFAMSITMVLICVADDITERATRISIETKAGE